MPILISDQTAPSPPSQLSCDVAVVGSGPGGTITACLLAEAGRDVVLVEEGAFLPLQNYIPFSRKEMVDKYRNGGLTVAMGKPKIQYAIGQCVGGGSEVNSGLYHRPPSEILARWRQEFAVEDLHEADLIPHFEACEKAVNVCYMPGQPPKASLKLHEGATRLGWKSMEVPRWFRYSPLTDPEAVPKGTRQSMTETFLPRALAAGCQLLTDTKVLSIKRQGSCWVLKAQHYSTQSYASEVTISANTIFVAGGAVQTPALLRRSGITRNIGNSLKMHPTIKVTAQFAEQVNAEDMGVPVHQVKEFSPTFSFGCSISSRPYLALAMNDHPAHMKVVDQDWQNMAIYYAMITGSGQGSVRCLPGFGDPLVRYALTEQDLKDLSEGLKKLSMLLFEAGATALYPSITNCDRLTEPSDLETIPERLPRQRTNLMTIHLFSSCPMGENKKRCATDSFGKVHGMENLYIADGSLLCTALGVNPQGTIMAIAHRNAMKFLGKL